MAEVPIPFTEQSIDTDDDASTIGLTLVFVAIGFAALAMLQDAGSTIYNKANSVFSDVTGRSLDGSQPQSQGGV